MPPKRPFLLGFFFFGAFLLCLLGLWWSEIALPSKEKQFSLSTQPGPSHLFLRAILRASWLLFLLGGAVLLRFPRRFFRGVCWRWLGGGLWVWSAFLDGIEIQKLQHLLQEAPLFCAFSVDTSYTRRRTQVRNSGVVRCRAFNTSPNTRRSLCMAPTNNKCCPPSLSSCSLSRLQAKTVHHPH